MYITIIFNFQSWMTNVHQIALANALQVSFVNLEEKEEDIGVEPARDAPHQRLRQLVLLERGQVMHSGNGPTRATVFLRYERKHFDILEQCQADDKSAMYVWDLEATVTYFRVVRVAKDHACGWTSTAHVLNQAKVPIPAALQAPNDE